MKNTYDKEQSVDASQDFSISTSESFELIKTREIIKLDSGLKEIRIPVILLERLKKEFDDSQHLSDIMGK